MSARDKLIALFRDVLNLPPGVDVPSLRYRGVAQWDSIAHMQLVAAIETAFDVMLETEQVIDMSSFEKAVEILESHGVQFHADAG